MPPESIRTGFWTEFRRVHWRIFVRRHSSRLCAAVPRGYTNRDWRLPRGPSWKAQRTVANAAARPDMLGIDRSVEASRIGTMPNTKVHVINQSGKTLVAAHVEHRYEHIKNESRVLRDSQGQRHRQGVWEQRDAAKSQKVSKPPIISSRHFIAKSLMQIPALRSVALGN